MTMIEKMQRAMVEAIAKQNVNAREWSDFNGVIPPIRWDDVAREVVEAMKEPTDGMKQALYKSGFGWLEIDNFVKIMIEAALAEPPSPQEGLRRSRK